MPVLINGDAPLRGYRKLPRDARVMDAYGARCWTHVQRFLSASNAGDVLIVGHAVLTQAIFFASINGRAPHQSAMREQLAGYVLKQATAFKLGFENGVPVSLDLA